MAILAAFIAFACVAGQAHAAGMSTETRQQYLESGKYEQDLNVVSEKGRSWIKSSVKKLAPRVKACKKRGFKVGFTDPGPDPAADYTVPVATPTSQMPKFPNFAGPNPGPAAASTTAKPKKKGKKHKPRLPKVTKKICGNTKQIAIAMDMDETATSTFRYGSSTPRYDYPGANANVALGTQTALNPMLKTYKLARKLRVPVFVITARPDIPALRTITEKNLADVGYTDLAGVYMKPAGLYDTGEVKNAERAELVRHRGYRVIAMFGDQDSDLFSGFFERGFKFPDIY